MSKSKCCVRGCKSSPPHFKFPTSRVLIRKWLAALGSAVDTKASVCSRHFRAEEWECARGRARLNKGVVPSVFDEDIKHDDTANVTENVPKTNDKNQEKNKLKDSQNSKKRTGRQKESDDPLKGSSDPEKESRDPEKESGDQEESKDPEKERNGPEKGKDPEKDTDDPEKDKQGPEKESDDQQKDMLGEKEMSNGKEDIGEERVQERAGKEIEEASKSSNSLDSKKNKDKSKESTPKLPSGPRDIDKDKVEDIEELLTYYHIKQNNIHNTEEVTEDQRQEETVDEVEIEFEPSQPVDPVFIEISVDKDTTATGGDKNDCLMVLESVQVEVDPSALMLQEQDYHEADAEMETLEIEEDAPNEKEDPISLLTSSDEDDVIIQEPHIDTVEVSDETDEDDMPLVKLLRKRKVEKKKNVTKKVSKKNDPTIAQITWGLYDYYCVQCHYKTSNAADYRKHMASHAKVILMCQLCGYMTASSSQFAKHEKQHGEKMYKCHLCDFKAKRNISLVYHMKTHKEVSKEFKCGECDFVAYSDQAILRHLRFCSDGKKYKCDKCSYATKKRSDLKRHMSSKHNSSNEDKDEDYIPPPGCLD